MTKSKIEGQFIPHPVEMIRSPAYAALSLSDRRVLDRVELEHAAHSGKDNGDLIITYRDFEGFGLYTKAISASLNACEALGFIAVARSDPPVRGSGRPPNRYRLTYLPTSVGGPTNEWRLVATVGEAKAVAKAARGAAVKPPMSTPQNHSQTYPPKPQSNPKCPPPKTTVKPPNVHPPKPQSLSIPSLPEGRLSSKGESTGSATDEGTPATKAAPT